MNTNYPPHGKQKVENEARSMLADMLAEMLLSDPNVPDKDKVAVQLVATAKKFDERFFNFALTAAEAVRDNCTPEAEQKARDLLEYIQLVSAGFDSFVEAHNSGTV